MLEHDPKNLDNRKKEFKDLNFIGKIKEIKNIIKKNNPNNKDERLKFKDLNLAGKIILIIFYCFFPVVLACMIIGMFQMLVFGSSLGVIILFTPLIILVLLLLIEELVSSSSMLVNNENTSRKNSIITICSILSIFVMCEIMFVVIFTIY